MMPAAGTALCELTELAAPGAKGFVFGKGLARTEVFLVRTIDGAVFGYRNTCPHQGTPLETFGDKFLTADGTYIVCSTHGARFRPEDGVCVAGPCTGQALTPVSVHIERGLVTLA